MTQTTKCKELFFLRGIACLSIVLLHAIGLGLTSITKEGLTGVFFDSIHVLLYFATPLFIFISMFILGYSYRHRPLPHTFLKNRILYLFLPFLFMAFFYSIPYASSFKDWGLKFLLNSVIGDYHGYFVLIIFQFFVLYLLLHKVLPRFNPAVVLISSFIINASYLAFFNFTTPWAVPYADYIWERFYWVPFLGWLFYFTLGYYCGTYYERFMVQLEKWKGLVLAGPLLTSALLLFFYHSDWLAIHSSKRIDMLFHTMTVGFFLFYIANKMQTIPQSIVFISQYSFGIYLLHMFYQAVFDFAFQFMSINLGYSYIFLLFAGSTMCSIYTIQYVSRWKYAAYLIGKVGIGYQQPSTRKTQKAIQSYSSHTG
ncbi:acyltransferase family protein [Halalkalibacter urbisdiaboli]|uniref:acyltransferase family protein n=1 Tax=Halalkalibacter urbisdiaboli TaxID=1960589 RepID=UPI000B4339E0|nr:acyltransferase family protein [Halalkalibacter urbisdiaboli]